MTNEQTVQLRTMAVDLAVRNWQPGDNLINRAEGIYAFIMTDINAAQEAKKAAVVSSLSLAKVDKIV